jgi:hypothetical protein
MQRPFSAVARRQVIGLRRSLLANGAAPSLTAERTGRCKANQWERSFKKEFLDARGPQSLSDRSLSPEAQSITKSTKTLPRDSQRAYALQRTIGVPVIPRSSPSSRQTGHLS